MSIAENGRLKLSMAVFHKKSTTGLFWVHVKVKDISVYVLGTQVKKC